MQENTRKALFNCELCSSITQQKLTQTFIYLNI